MMMDLKQSHLIQLFDSINNNTQKNEYLSENRCKGKEYDSNGNLIFEGEYRKGE